MSELESGTPAVRPSRRMWWFYGAALAALALVGLIAASLSYHLRTEAVLRDWANGEIEGAEAVERLGGPERAAARLGFYLRVPVPERFSTHRAAAPSVLGFCGRPAIPLLLRSFGDSDLDVNCKAIEAFGLIGREAVPALVAALGDKRDQVRWFAADALDHLGPEAAGAVPALIKALDDPDDRVRLCAAAALGNTGPDAAAAVPHLIPLVKLRHEYNTLKASDLAVCAMEALGRIGPRSAAAVPAIMDVLDTDPEHREPAARALGRIGPAVAPVMPALLRVLDASKTSDQQGERAAAAIALGKIGPAARAAVPKLREKLLPKGCVGAEGLLGVRIELAAALWRITGEPKEAMQELTWACVEKHPLVYREGPPPNFFTAVNGATCPVVFSDESNPLAVSSLLALRRSILAAGGAAAAGNIKLLGDVDEEGFEGIDYEVAARKQRDSDRRNGTVSPPISRDQVSFRLLGWCIETPFHELKPGRPGGAPEKVLRQSLTKNDFEGPVDFDPAAFQFKAPEPR